MAAKGNGKRKAIVPNSKFDLRLLRSFDLAQDKFARPASWPLVSRGSQ